MRWADDMSAGDREQPADAPLLGLGSPARPRRGRVGRYQALQWAGARHPQDPLVITALLAACAEITPSDAGRALVTGEVVHAAARSTAQSGRAAVDTAVLGCAVTATLVCPDRPALDGRNRSDRAALENRLRGVLDIAASLMMLTPPPGSSAPGGAERVRLMRAGHAPAAGWLAARCASAGVLGMADAVDITVRTVTGAELGTPIPRTGGVGELLAALA